MREYAVSALFTKKILFWMALDTALFLADFIPRRISAKQRKGRMKMAESKVRDENYFMVSGWMLNRLNLKGVPLQVFSIIYGFTQDGETCFTGSLQYLMDFTNSSKPTIIKSLKELVDKGYILKYENEMNGVKFNKYKANLLVVKNLNQGSQETLPGGSQISLPGGSKETLPNNKDLDNKDNISKDIVDEVINLYHSICVSYPSLRAVPDKRRKAILARLGTYTMEDLKTVFQNAEASSFLKGKNDRNWSANFDWLIAEKNIVKVLEGNYADKGRKEVVPGWMDKRQLDEDEVAAIQRMMQEDVPEVNVGNNPDLAERAERLRQMFNGG